jgi:glycosyltransferase involved in cell wall biosynthesis
MADASARPVHHHLFLERRGGAAKVAWTLAASQAAGRRVSLSFEAAEPGEPFPGQAFACEPAGLAVLAPPDALVHVHATSDWNSLLKGFAATPRPLVITVHDCSLVTGGCVYPVTCPKHAQACPGPCPRDYPDSAANLAQKRELVAAARPLLVSPSSWLAGMLRASWPGLAARVIPNGVDVPAVLPDKAQARAKLGVAPGARAALFLAHGGTQAAYKGGGRAEALFQALSERVHGLLGVVAGGGETARREGLLTLPYVEGELLSTLLRACDALIYPSLADNHPLVILEAMAHALPVAAYKVGGVPEQVLPGRTGLLAPPGDEAGLVREAARCLNDPLLARSLGLAARDRAEAHFTAGRMARDYEKAYERAERGGRA